jgi:hypothetical protein
MDMKKITFTLFMAVFLSVLGFAQQDVEGTKDNPMFPGRMTNYFRSESTTNFDAVDFNLEAGGSKTVSKEGTKSFVA